jgi:hypothetical protein
MRGFSGGSKEPPDFFGARQGASSLHTSILVNGLIVRGWDLKMAFNHVHSSMIARVTVSELS